MFGLEFGLFAALAALPLAGLPVVLHLLFRRKSPVVPFSTLRFIKTSVQRTAARKRVQRWLLLACRALLLALLIWAVSQPASRLASGWAGTGGSRIAAIVVDTSYSMALQEQQDTLLSRASAAVEDLLRDHLNASQVAVFRSAPAPADKPEQLRPASEILSQWTPLAPQPARRPLLDRVAAAIDLLKRQQAQEKWLFVISDFQAREFPSTLPEFPGGKTVLIDLRPGEPRVAGITRVAIEPSQPIPGLQREAVVDVSGKPGDTREVNVSLTTVDGRTLEQRPTQVAKLDDAGRARVRVPLRLPAERWTLLRGALQPQDALGWDDTRTFLVEVPPRQPVALLDSPGAPPLPLRVAKLALDPSEGALGSWPLKVGNAPDPAPDTAVAVLVAGEWPSAERAAKLREFVRGGGTLVWFLRPGLDQTWKDLPDPQKAALLELLPGAPSAAVTTDDFNSVAPVSKDDPVLEGLTEARYDLRRMTVLRYVPIPLPEGNATTLLSLNPRNPSSRARPMGLAFRRPLGTGTVFTWSTLPDRQYGNVATHPVFLPMLVGMALRPQAAGESRNVELGKPLVVGGPTLDGIDRLRVGSPRGEVNEVPRFTQAGPPKFVFEGAEAPGLYTWRRADAGAGDEVLALSNVQFPSAEAELAYKPAESVAVPGPNVVVARSAAELSGKFATLNEAQPRWSLPIAIVLLLLCAEAFMGATSKLWKPPSLRAFMPRMGGAGAGA